MKTLVVSLLLLYSVSRYKDNNFCGIWFSVELDFFVEWWLFHDKFEAVIVARETMMNFVTNYTSLFYIFFV